MNIHDYKHELHNLVTSAFESAWEESQDLMIEAFREQEETRILLSQNYDNFGSERDLKELAQRFQANWAYENNANMTPIF